MVLEQVRFLNDKNVTTKLYVVIVCDSNSRNQICSVTYATRLAHSLLRLAIFHRYTLQGSEVT